MIDIGFALVSPRHRVAGEHCARSFYGGANGNGVSPGWRIAWHRLLRGDPGNDARLYLANVNGDLDLLRAERWMAGKGSK
ncbi:MAG: hypothetical protein U0527_08030 [Candidatus Eisenbacteria bacterium]